MALRLAKNARPAIMGLSMICRPTMLFEGRAKYPKQGLKSGPSFSSIWTSLSGSSSAKVVRSLNLISCIGPKGKPLSWNTNCKLATRAPTFSAVNLSAPSFLIVSAASICSSQVSKLSPSSNQSANMIKFVFEPQTSLQRLKLSLHQLPLRAGRLHKILSPVNQQTPVNFERWHPGHGLSSTSRSPSGSLQTSPQSRRSCANPSVSSFTSSLSLFLDIFRAHLALGGVAGLLAPRGTIKPSGLTLTSKRGVADSAGRLHASPADSARWRAWPHPCNLSSASSASMPRVKTRRGGMET